MSLMIKGMEMPESCKHCRYCIAEETDDDKYLEPQTYDLCPKCYSSFIEWLNEYKQKEDAE